MDEYRKKLKIQNIFFIIGSIALITVQILAFIGVIAPISSDERFSDFLSGFIAGASLGITLIMIIGIIINIIGLHNNEKLKKLYIKENDERNKEISIKGKSSGSSAFSFFMIIAAIISGYFSSTIFFTIIACDLALCLFMVGGKIYYSKKM